MMSEAEMGDEEKTVIGKDGETKPISAGNTPSSAGWGFRGLVQKIEVDLLPQKAYFFTFGYAFGSVGPFLEGYFKQRGMTDRRIRIMTGIRPFVAFIFIPLINVFCDYFQKRKIALLVSLMALILMMSIMGVVPPPEEKSCEEIQKHLGNKTNVSQSSHLLGGGGGEGGRKRSLQLVIRQSDDFLPIDDNNNSDISDLVDDLEGDGLHDRSWLYTESSLDSLFAGYMALLIVGEMFTSPTESLADTATFYSLGEKRLTYYGIQRACAAFAHILSVFPAIAILKLSQLVIERCNGLQFYFHHYKILFFIFDGWMLLAFLVVFFKFEYGDDKPRSTYNPKSLLRMAKTPHYASILLVTIFFGMCNGLIRGFLFGYLRELGGDETLLGLATLLLYGSEIVMFCSSHWLIQALGFVWVMYFGLICYIIRFLMYALITDPWCLLPAEVLQGISYAAVWASITTYLAKAVTSDNYATVLGVLHALYWGLGNGLGHFGGGAMIDGLGMQNTFWSFCIASAVVLIIFGTMQKLFPSGHSELEGGYSDLEETKLIDDKPGTLYTSSLENNFDNNMRMPDSEAGTAADSTGQGVAAIATTATAAEAQEGAPAEEEHKIEHEKEKGDESSKKEESDDDDDDDKKSEGEESGKESEEEGSGDV
ncbi:major facilitator superfamily domain-containing protein 6-like [Glandiceps talaboti]